MSFSEADLKFENLRRGKKERKSVSEAQGRKMRLGNARVKSPSFLFLSFRL